MKVKASPYPLGGHVEVIRDHESRGPTGWYGNKHNDAVGWYWFQSTCRDDADVRSTVFKNRSDAERDAVRAFWNIKGWKNVGPHRRIALV